MVEASCFRGQREAAADLTGIPEIIITHSVFPVSPRKQAGSTQQQQTKIRPQQVILKGLYWAASVNGLLRGEHISDSQINELTMDHK